MTNVPVLEMVYRCGKKAQQNITFQKAARIVYDTPTLGFVCPAIVWNHVITMAIFL